MTKLLASGLTSLLILAVSVAPCAAWGEVGHRVVGRIAASLLTPIAQSKVADILGVDNTKKDVADALADAAEWPDSFARTHFPQSVPWHFIDLGLKPHPAKDGELWTSDDTAFAKIVQYFNSVKHGAPDELEPASDLEFIAHLVGDIHQPLHSTTNRDRGGNCLFIKYADDEGGVSARTKFHSAMDTAFVEDHLGTNDRLIAREFVKDNKTKLASEVSNAHAQLVADPVGTIRQWIEESHGLAVTRLYGALRPVVPSFVTAVVASDP